MHSERKIAVIGLGYVGLPVAVALSRHYQVTGFDTNTQRIEELRKAHDRTNELNSQQLKEAKMELCTEPEDIQQADFYIITVPTPVGEAKQPDLEMVRRASEMVGSSLTRGDIVVYESTVYPGATEEVCIPILEKASGFEAGKDFFVGYSPERINPGDQEHGISSIIKVISGQNKESLDIIEAVYEKVVDAGVYRAPSIKVAEAAKVIENTQRDLNIALMNELAIIFDRLDIDTGDVVEAASTKWNFIPFTPGLVGGHCIGVDPYYLTYKSEQAGYAPEVILAGRGINDSMGKFIAARLKNGLLENGCSLKGSIVTVLGFTFKENIPDIRNTGVINVIRELLELGVQVQVHDQMADISDAQQTYDIELLSYREMEPAHAVLFAVCHKEYVQKGWELMQDLLIERAGIVFDIKGVLDRDRKPASINLLRL